jgi:hypothetical protein
MRPNTGGKSVSGQQHKLICGMTESTAQRYIVVRKELDIVIKNVHKSGYWLSEFEKADPQGMCKTLSLMGLSIMHAMAQIHDYLENEFVSLEKVYDAVNKDKE